MSSLRYITSLIVYVTDHCTCSTTVLIRQPPKTVQSGADPNRKSDSGRIALHEACQSGHQQIVTLLLEVSDPSIKDRQGRTAGHLAASNGELQCLTSLYEAGNITE